MTEERNGQDKEYIRWKDYANALMLALTVLFAGPAIGGHEDGFSIASVVLGVFGIVSVAAWHAREWNPQFRGKPAFLWVASATLGLQAGFLVCALWLR